MAEAAAIHVGPLAGTGLLEVGIGHPIVAPLRQALETGKPPGAWTWVTIRDEFLGISKLLGSFVHTLGNRLLFFPGANVSISRPPDRETSEAFDHLTLDPPKSDGKHVSHLALRNGERGQNFRSTAPQGHLLPWFSLVTTDLSRYATIPETVTVVFEPPRPDLSAFAEELMKRPAVAETRLPLGGHGTYFQMDVWASWEPSWSKLAARPLPWPYESGLVVGIISDEQEITASDLKIPFGEAGGVRILCSRPQGLLRRNAILRPSLKG